MRLLQEAIKTYDHYEQIAGTYQDNMTPLIPVSHMLKKLDVVITVDGEGNFCTVQDVSKDNIRAIIPATKYSFVRTADVSPHPLCDGLSYIGRYSKKDNGDYSRNDKYKELLGAWAGSPYTHQLVDAVYKYVTADSVLKDLSEAGLIELDEKGCPKKDAVIGWILETKDETIKCWEDHDLMECWQKYALTMFSDDDKVTCMLTGDTDYYWPKHPKGVVPGCDANAKLISQEYTDNKFWSRFVAPQNKGQEDLVIGYISSQKAHNALKWMLSNYAITKRNTGVHRDILCWSPTQVDIINPVKSIIPHDDANNNDDYKATESESYKKLLKRVFLGYKTDDTPYAPDADVIVATFDGMTPGRVAITYYNEMKLQDYLDRLLKWDMKCCYYSNKYGYVSPSIDAMIRYAYGSPKLSNSKMYMDIKSEDLTRELQKLLSCKLEGNRFPLNIKQMLVHRAGNPNAYDRYLREKLVQYACAAVRASRMDRNMEDIGMMLDTDRIDKDYLFGRLIAIFEKIEYDVYRQRQIDRTTNAERLWQSYEKKPLYIAKSIISKQKSAYYPRLSPAARVYYEKMIEDIFGKLMTHPEKELNRPLGEIYLLGYYAQKNAFYIKKSDKNEDDTDIENDEEA